jgi:hypothetical protein
MSEVRTVPRDHDPERPPARVAQWVGFVLAPAVFFAHLEITYLLVPWACLRSADVWLHVVDALALVLAILSAVVARRAWSAAGRDEPGEEGGSLPRTRLVGALGFGLSAMLALLLAWQWLTAFFIGPCQ